MLWWCGMEKVLLFSNHKEIFEVTNKIIEGKYKLLWCTYDLLKENQYPYSDVVIMHFDKKMIKRGTFEPIIKVKGRLGHTIPILVLIEDGTTQDIFSTLKAGAYDYLETVANLQEYRKKIEDIILWDWYLKKYGSEVK